MTPFCDVGADEDPLCKLCRDTIAALQPLVAIYVARTGQCGKSADVPSALGELVSQVVGPLLQNLSSTAVAIKSDVRGSYFSGGSCVYMKKQRYILINAAFSIYSMDKEKRDML